MTTGVAGAPRMLVVDDEAGIVASLMDYFSGLGYTVDAATEAHAAIELLERYEYVAVVSDLRLSGNGLNQGLDVLAYARRRFPRAACIALTACGDSRNEQLAIRHGADALIQKPAPLSYLAGRIGNFAAGARRAAAVAGGPR